MLPLGFWGAEHPHTARHSEGSPCFDQIREEEPRGSQILLQGPFVQNHHPKTVQLHSLGQEHS